jgi:hypothetical protein
MVRNGHHAQSGSGGLPPAVLDRRSGDSVRVSRREIWGSILGVVHRLEVLGRARGLHASREDSAMTSVTKTRIRDPRPHS